MGIGKRLFEKPKEWLTRVMTGESVDYAIGTDKESGEELLYFTENYGRQLEVGAHSLDDGPQIGRYIPDDETIRNTDFQFFSLKPSVLSGVINAPAPRNGIVDQQATLAPLADALGQFKGRHVFTDPRGRRWFMFHDTFGNFDRGQSPIIKLTCEKGIENYGGQGHMMAKLAHLYKGTWHFGDDLGAVTLLDKERIMSHSGERIVPEDLVNLYGIEETDAKSVAGISVLYPAKGLAATVKHFRLTLRLHEVSKGNEVVDIKPLLNRIVATEWPNNRVVIHEDRIKFQLHTEEMYTLDLRQRYGFNYYNSLTEEKNQHYTLKNPTLHRSFA
jgi:hypothetical protein